MVQILTIAMACGLSKTQKNDLHGSKFSSKKRVKPNSNFRRLPTVLLFKKLVQLECQYYSTLHRVQKRAQPGHTTQFGNMYSLKSEREEQLDWRIQLYSECLV